MFTVGAEESKLVSVTKKSKFALYDANIRLTDVRVEDGALVAKTDYAAEAECVFENIPYKILFNEKELPFEYNADHVTFIVPCAGEIRFVMA